MSSIERSDFGRIGDEAVHLYTLKNRHGAMLRVTSYGATLTELHVPDRFGRLGDIVLGFDSLDGYVKHTARPASSARRPPRLECGRLECHAGGDFARSESRAPPHVAGRRRGLPRSGRSHHPLYADT
jgi:aldose 1-epimerase